MNKQQPGSADHAVRAVYQPPIIVSAGSFRVATRGGSQLDVEIRIGRKAN